MDLSVHAHVAAVPVADHVGLLEGVVERGVEGGETVLVAAADPDLLEDLVPGPAAGLRHVLDAGGRGDLGSQVLLGAGQRDVGDAEPHVDDGVGRRVEGDVASGAAAGPARAGQIALAAAGADGPRVQLSVVPRAHGGEGAVEGGAEVQAVVALAVVVGATAVGTPAAERAGLHPAGDLLPRGVDVDVRVLAAVEGVGDPEEQAGGPVLGEGEVGDAGPLRDGEVGGDARVEAHPVAAGLSLLVGVREVRSVCGVLGVGGRRRVHVPDEGHDRHVARRARVAARAVDVGEGEAAQPGGVVRVAVGGGGVGLVARGAGRRPADHPERHGGTGVGVAAVGGADQRVHVRDGVPDKGRRDGGRARRGTAEQREEQPDRDQGCSETGRRTTLWSSSDSSERVHEGALPSHVLVLPGLWRPGGLKVSCRSDPVESGRGGNTVSPALDRSVSSADT